MDKLKLFVPITKVDEAKRLVYGVIAEERIDKSGEIFDYVRSKPRFEAWSKMFADVTGGKSAGNLRVMHTPIVAGHAEKIAFNDDAKQIEAVAKVTDDNEWKKVVAGDYTGFSIGGRYVERWQDAAKAMRYEADPVEFSLADNPCMYGATFSAIKADGSTDLRKFVGGPLLVALNAFVADLAKSAPALASEGVMKRLSEFVDGLGLDSDQLVVSTEGNTIVKIAARDDTSPKEGESKYGDVTFADPKNKKYPIDTEPRIRAAWNYINKPKNAGKYSAKDAASIKRKIIAAWKAKIDKDGPPSAGKAAAVGLRKGMYAVQLLAGILDQLDSLLAMVEAETAMEGDGSTIADDLETACAALGAILAPMSEEEAGELHEDYAPSTAPDSALAQAAPAPVRKAEPPVPEPDKAAHVPGKQDVAVPVDTKEPVSSAVPPATDAGTVERVLAPLFERIEKLEKTVTAGFEKRDAPGAVVKADLDRFATAESVSSLQKQVGEVKEMVARIPAPPSGRPALKTLGSGEAAGTTTTPDLSKAVDDLVAAGALDPAAHQAIRLKLAQRAMPR